MATAARRTQNASAPKSTSANKPASTKATGKGRAGKGAATNAPTLTKEEELHAYREMLLIRRFEEKAGQMYGMGLIGGFCHLYIGQEAVVRGHADGLAGRRPGDHRLPGSRPHAGHGHGPQGGCSPSSRAAGAATRGARAGPMHMFSKEKHFYGGHGIVGAQVPLGTGIAFANRYRDEDRVSMVYFGDGAANQGQVYESFNMAALWKLPVVYVIENNRLRDGHVGGRARRRSRTSPSAASPSASRASRSTAWTSAPSATRASGRSSMRARGRGPSSSRC